MTDFYATWHESYAIGWHPKVLIYIFFYLTNTNVADVRTCEVGATVAPVTLESWNNIW
jgi:hypothetical protein